VADVAVPARARGDRSSSTASRNSTANWGLKRRAPAAKPARKGRPSHLHRHQAAMSRRVRGVFCPAPTARNMG
jgi:hypothetical protein